MSQAALPSPRVLSRLAEPEKRPDDEAARLADLQAAFEHFGVRESSNPHAELALRPAQAVVPARKTRPAFPLLRPRLLRLNSAFARAAIKILDWLVLGLAAELAAHWSLGLGLFQVSLGQAGAFLLAAGTVKLGLWLTGAYQTPVEELKPEHGVGGLALGVILSLGVAVAVAPDARSASALCALLPAAAILLAGAHAAFAALMAAGRKHGAFAERIVLIGATEAAARFIASARETHDVQVVAVIDDRLERAPEELGGAPVSGSIDQLLSWGSLPEVDRIVITVTQRAESRVRHLVERLRATPNRIDLLLDFDASAVHGARVRKIGATPIATVSGRARSMGAAFVKRAEDLSLAVALLAVFAPVMLLIAAAIRIDSKGPVIYRQRRHGFNNRVITVHKFRTMRHDPGAPLKQVIANDPRVTRIGRLLRRTSLDELPQLFNVLAGEMSLVGPRPHAVGMKADERDLQHIVAEYAHRHRVKPGITGWAQINGSRGPVETPALVRERLRLDLDYVSRASLLLDLWILIRTAPALLGDFKATR